MNPLLYRILLGLLIGAFTVMVGAFMVRTQPWRSCTDRAYRDAAVEWATENGYGADAYLHCYLGALATRCSVRRHPGEAPSVLVCSPDRSDTTVRGSSAPWPAWCREDL